jgi:hypothetical protein
VIARIWTRATHDAAADADQEYMRETALPVHANVIGNRVLYGHANANH